MKTFKLFLMVRLGSWLLCELSANDKKSQWTTFSMLLLLSRFSRVRLCATPQPTRLPCPWDSPSKSTGVGCHFHLQCMKLKSEIEVTQSCPTLNDPMDCSLPGSSVHGIFQARVLEWGAIAFSKSIYTLRLFENQNECNSTLKYSMLGFVSRRGQWHPTPVLLLGESHGWRSLVDCSPWGSEESDMTEWLHFHFSLSCIGGGNGNPLQCSCPENPRDGRAWWAAVYGVAQSRTRLKRLSSSSSRVNSLVVQGLGVSVPTPKAQGLISFQQKELDDVHTWKTCLCPSQSASHHGLHQI